ncbi:MAG: CBS domain-containing protein, partial [Rhodospirillales bacterium]|nr:CBS domain-containing protein [Rhodospirillales bacterium]
VLAEGRSAARTTLAEVMTPNPDSLPPRASAIEALHLMTDGGFRHVPVVEQDRVAGIVSFADFRGIERAHLDDETGYWEIM